MALELTNEQLSHNTALILVNEANLLAKYNMLDVSGAVLSISYMDGSMSKFATNASVGIAFASNSSLGNISMRVTMLDASIKNYATNASVNTANFTTNASVAKFATNASVNTANFATNASVNTANFATNASVAKFATNASVGLALGGYTTNASAGTAFTWIKAYTDGSLSTLNASVNTANFTTNASVAKFATNASVGLALGGYATNASIATNGIVKEYIAGTDYRIGLKDGSGVNGSMFVKNSSIYLKINNFWTMFACTSIGLGL